MVLRQEEEGDIFFMVEEGELEAFIVNSTGNIYFINTRFGT